MSAQATPEAPAESRPRVYTIPPGRGFLDALAAAILAGDLPVAGGPAPGAEDLPAYTLLLPTRRASRALAEAFLGHAKGRAMLLPRIRPIGEGAEELTLLSGLAAPEGHAGDALDIPPAVSEIERRLALTSLVLRWSQAERRAAAAPDAAPFAASGATTPAQAAQLAAELARLMDMVETEGVSLSALAGIVPDTFTEHWQRTLGFLEIVMRWWPAHLTATGALSPAERRNRVMRAEARRLAAQGSAGPVIVAGVTGSIPASADLMRVVARLAAGAIVLPGLDQELDEESWRRIAPADRASAHAEHPQHSLARLLEALGTTRRAVTVLPGAHPTPAAAARARLVGEALRPAATTDRWYEFTRSRAADEIDAALAGLACIAAPSAQDEAEAVALILRRAAETPGRTAALVTPDRILARRVALRLESWGIRVDDSAGRPLAKTVPGAFLDLVIAAAERRFAPATLMALLKHPLLRLGLPVGQVRRAARALELIVFRRAHFGQGLAGVAAALDRPADDDPAGGRESRAGRRLRESDREAARALVAQLADAFAPLARLAGRDDARPLHEHAGAHLAAAEALARLAEADAPSPLWQGEAGEAAALVFTGLIDPTLPAPAVRAGEYPDLYRGLVATETVRARIPAHPRLSIWGPFEARLQQPDVLVLGGLNEGTWPAAAETGPWLNRPMRSTLGLPQPEAAIGNAAHDLSQLLGAGTVYLTRAAKVDGVPTVPSRWLLRLFAVLDGLGGPPAEVRLAPREPWLGWARSRDVARPEPRRETGPPAPRPALALRPRRLSVSDVETWIANPYAIFASRILGLEPLPALASPPDAALRGAILHTALRRFAAAHPDALPADVADRLVAEAAAALHALGDNPRVAAFWRPRLARFAAWFAESEPERRAGVTRVLAEVPGTRVLDAPAGPFVLTARADRIDLTPGGLVVTDYKTTAGLQPLARRALAGSAPQLALEAAIALAGGFPGVPAGPVTALRYISAAGGEPAGDSIDIESEDIAALARAAEEGLARLVARFDDPATPYAALRRARFDYTFDDYAHLARVAEWSGSREGDA